MKQLNCLKGLVLPDGRYKLTNILYAPSVTLCMHDTLVGLTHKQTKALCRLSPEENEPNII